MTRSEIIESVVLAMFAEHGIPLPEIVKLTKEVERLIEYAVDLSLDNWLHALTVVTVAAKAMKQQLDEELSEQST